MLDASASAAAVPSRAVPARAAQPRAEGEARVRARLKGGADRVAGLYQRGSAKCFIPRQPGLLEAVFLNTAGGLTGGDRFEWAAETEEGACLTVSTQAAERIYRAQPEEEARAVTRLRLAAGSRLSWLPQETILFDGAALNRRLEVEMATDAVFTGIEPLLLGRAAMGETVREARFRDAWRLRRGGALIWADGLRLVGDAAAIAGRAACFGGARGAATLVHAAPGAGDLLEPARNLLGSLTGAQAAASAFDDLLVMRIVARDGMALRRAALAAMRLLRGAEPPRVWLM